MVRRRASAVSNHGMRSSFETRARAAARSYQDEEKGYMTFDDVRKIALAWSEVEDGTSYGTPALKVRKKLLVRLKEDGDSLVMPGVPHEERGDAGGRPAQGVLLHRSLQGLSDGVDPAVSGQARDSRAAVAPAMANAGIEESGRSGRSVG